MAKNILFGLFIGLSSFSTSFAGVYEDAGSEIVKVSVGKAYIPQGFDNNDVVKIVVEGFFPSTCYKIKKKHESGDVIVDPVSKEIMITQHAYYYKGNCKPVTVPYVRTVEVGKLPNDGNYKLVDAFSGRELGVIPVRLSTTAGPDDFTYAIMSDAYVSLNGDDENVIVLKGELPSNCWKVVEKRAFVDGPDVLTVLPIIEEKKPGQICSQQVVPFATDSETS